MDLRARHTAFIKQQAKVLGFDHCGIAEAVQLEDDARRLEQWLQKGMHGGMHYMENHFDMRIDPRKLVPGAQSVITLLLNYYPEQQQRPDAPQIAKYAYGADYHEVIRGRLNQLLQQMQAEIGDIAGRGFVDSAPVLERAWAQRSGLGWVGKNGNIIHKQAGSFFFIATLVVDLPLIYDGPVADYCGSCTRCLDACPTGALVQPGVVDGSRCISYLTIELKELLIPERFEGQMQNWAFGCDICQDVCPWNRFAKPHQQDAFRPIPEILNLSTQEWESMSEDAFRLLFKQSAIKRSKHRGLQRNLQFLKLRGE